MTISAIAKIIPVWFTPKTEIKQENPARFKLKQLNGMEHAEVIHHLERDEDDKFILPFKGIKAALKYGLIDWENVIDVKGEQIPFNKENIALIPGHYIPMIANEVLKLSNISEDDEKK